MTLTLLYQNEQFERAFNAILYLTFYFLLTETLPLVFLIYGMLQELSWYKKLVRQHSKSISSASIDSDQILSIEQDFDLNNTISSEKSRDTIIDDAIDESLRFSFTSSNNRITEIYRTDDF